jgi:hypothetical protein
MVSSSTSPSHIMSELTIRLYYNGVSALNFTNLELRSSDTLASIGGLYFSTFFGGDDVSWATPTEQFTYYKNMQVFAGQGQSTGEGKKSGAGRVVALSLGMGVLSVGVIGALGMII